MARQVQLKDVKKGEFFVLNLTDEEQKELSEVKEAKVWIRDDYDRTEKKVYTRIANLLIMLSFSMNLIIYI